MISDFTLDQINTLRFSSRPLVICDVDEVIVHFTRDFEAYIANRGYWLDFASLALHGNIRNLRDHAPASEPEVNRLVSDFFSERTLHLETIDGAVESLVEIGRSADVVLLTNLPHSAGGHRRENLARHGLSYPVVTNAGPKGPAISEIVRRAGQTAVFIDDSPAFIASAYDHAPGVHLVHFLHDDRFARHIEPVDYVSLRTASWAEARPHVMGLIGGP